MIALFGLFAEVERDLISERTKEGLAAAKAKGKLLGRPKGALGTSRLDGKEQDIREAVGQGCLQGLDRQDRGRLPLRPASLYLTRESSILKLHSRSQSPIVLKGYFCSNMGGTTTAASGLPGPKC